MIRDTTVRAFIYDAALLRGVIPRAAEIAGAVARPESEVRESLARLAEAHMLVLQPASGEILMAVPFSAVPTPFLVETDGAPAYGNCIWDALGIAAMRRRDAVVHCACGCCGEKMDLHVENGVLREREGIAHYAVPARRWWDDIAFT